MCVNSLAHTHLCGSHTCQSGFSLTERRKSEWETQQFAGAELLASVLLVGLSVHVQRQRLCALLSGGRWAWVLSTEGFWHVHVRLCVWRLCGVCVELSCGLSGASRAPPHSFVTERERHNLKQPSAFIPEWSRERLKQPSCERAAD